MDKKYCLHTLKYQVIIISTIGTIYLYHFVRLLHLLACYIINNLLATIKSIISFKPLSFTYNNSIPCHILCIQSYPLHRLPGSHVQEDCKDRGYILWSCSCFHSHKSRHSYQSMESIYRDL